MEEDREHVAVLSAILVTGGLANVFLLLSLAVTWKYWRQVRWPVLTMAVAHWLELGFRFGTDLAWSRSLSWPGASQLSCKFLMMMRPLGPVLANMALAALAVHTLVTVITGSQDSRVRIFGLLAVSVLLSLPVPLAQIPMYQLTFIPHREDGSYQCVSLHFFHSNRQQYGYSVGHVVATVIFPLLVIIVCGVVSRYLLAKRKGNMKGEEHVSDVIITGLLGAVIVVCCSPYWAFVLFAPSDILITSGGRKALAGVVYLDQCRIIISALVTAAFAYLYVYRHRPRSPVSPTTDSADHGEELKAMD